MYDLLMLEKNISSLLKSRNMSKNKLLINAGLSKSVFDNMKKGQNPSIDKIYVIAEYLNVSVDYLLTGKKESRPELTERQNVLLDMFDGLNNDGQIKLLETADDMSVSGKYKKHDIVSEVG